MPHTRSRPLPDGKSKNPSTPGPNLRSPSFLHSTISSFRSPGSPFARRRNGKVARLPARLRHRLNSMLRDGLPYSIIRRRLGKAARSLSTQNISRWKLGGYHDWLDRQHRIEASAAQLDLAADFLRRNPDLNIHETGLQIAVSQILDVLTHLDSASLQASVQDNPQSFLGLLNTLPKLTRGGLQFLLQRTESGDRKSRTERRRTTKSGIAGATHRLIEDEFHVSSEPSILDTH